MTAQIKNKKQQIVNRYKGRGNCWVKVEKESQAGEIIASFLSSRNDASAYVQNTDREGFYWMRFSKVEVENNAVNTVFEIRVNGSKLDHPDHRISFDDNIVEGLSLLGGTPHKLQLETEDKKQKKPSIKKINIVNEKDDNVEKEVTVTIQKEKNDRDINNILEKELTAPTKQELLDWTAFLSATGLLNEEEN